MRVGLLGPEDERSMALSYSPRDGFVVTGPERLAVSEDTARDLGLDEIVAAMAAGDALIEQVARIVVRSPLRDEALIAYRDEVLADCLEHPGLIRDLYETAVAAIIEARRVVSPFGLSSASSVLRSARDALGVYRRHLERLRRIADDGGAIVRSRGLRCLLEELGRQLDEGFFLAVDEHLRELAFERGVLVSAKLGPGNHGASYVLRRPERPRRHLREVVSRRGRATLHFDVDARDEAGARMLDELVDRAVAPVAAALAAARDHVADFLRALALEAGFFVGCVNLASALASRGRTTSVPQLAPPSANVWAYEGLYDVALALRSEGPIVGNDGDATGRNLVVITGANSGGKTTLARAMGQAFLLAQAGSVVGATFVTLSPRSGLFTHFLREEEAGYGSGKFEEELERMDAIVRALEPGALVCLNESFSSTNEREGSEVACQVIDAFIESDVRVIFVTHHYRAAHELRRRHETVGLFLRADPEPDGTRTYVIREGVPLPTSHAVDLLDRVRAGPGDGRGAPRGRVGEHEEGGEPHRDERVV